MSVHPPDIGDPIETMRKIQEIRQMQQQTELLRQRNEAMRQQNQQTMAAPSSISPALPPFLDDGKKAPTLVRPGERPILPDDSTAKPGSETFRTHGLLNGYFWQATPAPAAQAKMLVLIAYRDAVMYVATTTTDDYAAYIKLSGRFFPEHYTAAMVDEFYAVQENMRIPLGRALQIVVAKAAGVDPAEILKQTEEFRWNAKQP